jgi:hypothetical protein
MICEIIFCHFFTGPAEFDEEKISLASATGPASDISAGSANSNNTPDVKASAAATSSVTALGAAAAAPLPSSTTSSTNNSTGRKASRLSLQGLSVASSMSSLMKQPMEVLGGSSRSSMGRSTSRVNSRSLLNLFTLNNTNSQRQGIITQI